MTAKTAKKRQTREEDAKRVVVVVYPGVTLLDVTGPTQVFWTAREVGGRDVKYDIALAAGGGTSTVTDTGVSLGTISLKQAASSPIDTLLVAGGVGVFDACRDATLCRWIARNAVNARRVGSTCMGTFLMASAGVIADRKVTTHWRWADELRRRYPEISVEPDSIFVKDDHFWSSAGVTSGIDMALAMVEEDYGREIALKVAQSLVVYLRRPGGQSQFSALLSAQIADSEQLFERLHLWIASNLSADLRVERLAEKMGMSPRNFARLHTENIGLTPAKVVEKFRVEAARRLLEQPGVSLKQVMRRCGFTSLEQMRRAFLRSLHVAPSEYRDRFGVA